VFRFFAKCQRVLCHCCGKGSKRAGGMSVVVWPIADDRLISEQFAGLSALERVCLHDTLAHARGLRAPCSWNATKPRVNTMITEFHAKQFTNAQVTEAYLYHFFRTCLTVATCRRTLHTCGRTGRNHIAKHTLAPKNLLNTASRALIRAKRSCWSIIEVKLCAGSTKRAAKLWKQRGPERVLPPTNASNCY
jgi:hypothetical protein